MECDIQLIAGEVESVHHGIVVRNGFVQFFRALQGSGRIGRPARAAPYPAEFIQTSGQTPPQLGIVAIVSDELLVQRSGLLDQR